MCSVIGIKKTRESSKLLKDDGIVIYALGIGNEVRPGELDVLVSSPSPDHVFRFSSVKQMAFPSKAQEVAWLLCSGMLTLSKRPPLPSGTNVVRDESKMYVRFVR